MNNYLEVTIQFSKSDMDTIRLRIEDDKNAPYTLETLWLAFESRPETFRIVVKRQQESTQTIMDWVRGQGTEWGSQFNES